MGGLVKSTFWERDSWNNFCKDKSAIVDFKIYICANSFLFQTLASCIRVIEELTDCFLAIPLVTAVYLKFLQ